MKKKMMAVIAALMASAVVSTFAADMDLVVRMGGFGQLNGIVNGHGDDGSIDLGGGVSSEFGMPFALFGKQNGLGVHISGSGLLAQKSPVTSGADLFGLFGWWIRFPFGKTDFAFQPELSYGVVNKKVWSSDGSKNYDRLDQMANLSLSFRWNPLDICNGKLEFEFTPQVGVETFNSPVSVYIGARLGFLYIMGKNAGTAERIAERENKVVDATAAEIAADPDLKDAVSVYRSAEGVTICLDTINFKPDSAVLEDSEYPKLNKIAAMLKRYNNTLHVEGHCAKTADSTDEGDVEFSLGRAKTVADYLIQQGVRKTNTQMRVSGAGSSQPRADNTTEAGKQRNRRVEITLVRRY